MERPHKYIRREGGSGNYKYFYYEPGKAGTAEAKKYGEKPADEAVKKEALHYMAMLPKVCDGIFSGEVLTTEMKVVAACNTKTGDLYIGPKWKLATPEQKEHILYHEAGHLMMFTYLDVIEGNPHILNNYKAGIQAKEPQFDANPIEDFADSMTCYLIGGKYKKGLLKRAPLKYAACSEFISLVSEAQKREGTSSPEIIEYEKENDKNSEHFDALWKKADERHMKPEDKDKMFAEAREEIGLEAFKERLLAHREAGPRKMEFDYTDTPAVAEAVKGHKGHIEMISPGDFLRLASFDKDLSALHTRNFINLYKEMKKSKRFDVGFLDMNIPGNITNHEGRHRAAIARMWGIEKIPVAILGQFHKDFNVKLTRKQILGEGEDIDVLTAQKRKRELKGMAPDNKVGTDGKELISDIEDYIDSIESVLIKMLNREAGVIEEKSLVDGLLAGIVKFFDTDQWKKEVRAYITDRYYQELFASELKWDMNFLGDGKKIQQLADYAFGSIENVHDEVGRKLRGELQRGILNGDDLNGLKERIKQVFKDVDYTNRLKTVIRTEGLRAGNMASYEAAVETGRKLKKYLKVVVDDYTSEICLAENAKYGSPEKAIAIDDDFVVKVDNKIFRAQFPPFHPNCRTTADYVEDMSKQKRHELYGTAQDVEKFGKEHGITA